ncbi:glycoprotein N [Rhinolophus gammaherpesvirus 1]|uniref:Glycoprotein N n=1 Tax=Rhinolophus gammaherpesvirus 1 TaxID=2054179 RepID=A0A2Z5U6D7_9GAMA|nr:glycoprotein N [Rhinolophus gammaherpesvirus 1]BBB06505.1 glycoprotein N [Rhinolophus gammaherpesvirus 1]
MRPSKSLLWTGLLSLILCYLTIGINANKTTTPTTSSTATAAATTAVTSTASNDSTTVDFYSFTCNADTYALQLNSVSTIWTLIDVLIISVACSIYLMYMCFNKFVNTMATS